MGAVVVVVVAVVAVVAVVGVVVVAVVAVVVVVVVVVVAVVAAVVAAADFLYPRLLPVPQEHQVLGVGHAVAWEGRAVVLPQKRAEVVQPLDHIRLVVLALGRRHGARG